MIELVVFGAAVYTLGAVGLALHALDTEDYDALIVAPIWPVAAVGAALYVGLVKVWRRGR